MTMMILTTKLNLNWVNVNHHFKYLSQQYFTGKFLSGVLQLELVDKFCYLDDMLSVDGDADAAVEARIRFGWNKFRQLAPLLTNKDVSLIMRGRLYSSCVRNSMLHGSETWPVRKENVVALQRTEMRMVRWMCGVKLKDRLPSKELRESD